MTSWGIHRLSDMLGSKHCQTGMSDGRYYRSVPEPYTAGKLKAAWAVWTGKAYAVEWPKPGDLEKALER